MMTTPRQALVQRSNPVSHVVKASARAESLARPQDLLGTRPPYQIEYNTQLAEALQGPRAAEMAANLAVPSGSIINAQA